MRRRVANIVTGLSIVLCLATVILWVGSYRYSEQFCSVGRERGTVLLTREGDFGFYRSDRVSGSWRTKFAHDTISLNYPPHRWWLDTQPLERQWGPFTFVVMAPPPAPSAERVAEGEKAERAWQAVDNAPPPVDRPGRVKRSRMRAAAARAHSVLHPDTAWGVVFPAWLPFAATLILPAARAVLAWRPMRRRRLIRAGLCVRCGYDLRASPDRCPECGAGRAGAVVSTCGTLG
jgi:hypothetical protein